MDLIEVPKESLRAFHLEGAVYVYSVCDEDFDECEQFVVKVFRDE